MKEARVSGLAKMLWGWDHHWPALKIICGAKSNKTWESRYKVGLNSGQRHPVLHSSLNLLFKRVSEPCRG